MVSCLVRPARLLIAAAFLSLMFLTMPLLVAHADGEAQSSGCSGYYYTVRRGDTWSIISRRVGTSVADLKRANPQAVRPRDVIYAAENICIPSPSQGGAESGGYWRQVKPGDTWNTISRATGVPVRQLWEANPGLVNRRMWLYIGQRVWIPQAQAGMATPTPAATAATQPGPTTVPSPELLPTAGASATVGVSATEEPMTATPTGTATTVPSASAAPATAVPTATSTATLPVTVTPVPTAAATASTGPTAAPATSPTALPPKPADCPETLAGYDEVIARFLNNPVNSVEGLARWLLLCRVVPPEGQGALTVDITGSTSQDAVVTINDPSAQGPGARGSLLVYHNGQSGFSLAHKRQGQGRIDLIEAGDINADGKFDLAYSDTSCGAHTCFGTLFVDSWGGTSYTDWIEGEPTIAEPEYSVRETTRDGQGKEIFVHGGVIGSIGAGPQRAWTETYISPAGGAYRLLSQIYDPSNCLYHKIVDANRAFDAWALDGFEPAIEAYKAALADTNARACGTIKDEVKTLQDFARFRLAVADVAGGDATGAVKLAPQITHPSLKKAVTAFLASYAANSSVIQACRDTTKLAESDPSMWQFLADWGYANPSFTAQELCPLN